MKRTQFLQEEAEEAEGLSVSAISAFSCKPVSCRAAANLRPPQAARASIAVAHTFKRIRSPFCAAAFFFLLASAHAAFVSFTFTNSVGQPDTNAFKVIPVSGPVANADGSFTTIGLPIRITPAANGKATNQLAQNNYQVTNAFLGQGYYIRAPLDSGPTVYPSGQLLIPGSSGGVNVFVTLTVTNGGTNGNITLNQITNGLGGLPLFNTNLYPNGTTNGLIGATDATNIANALAGFFTNGSGAQATNFSLAIGANNTNHALALALANTNFALALGASGSNYAQVQALTMGTNGTNFANSIGAAGTNFAIALVGAAGTAATNFANGMGSALTNFSLALGAAGTNFTLFQFATLGTNGTNFANSIGLASTNFANGMGAAGTNFANGIGNAGTNFANSIGAAGTNFANGIGASDTNYTKAQIGSAGTASTNFTLTIAGSGSNYAQFQALTIGTNGTNFSLTLGTNGTNFALSLGTNGTNYANSIGAAGTNFVMVQSNNVYTNGTNQAFTYFLANAALTMIASNNLVVSNLAWFSASNTTYQSQFSAAGTAATNFSNGIGASGTNFANGIGAASTNFANGIGLAGTNFANSIGLANTNHALVLAQASTNYTLTVAGNGSNYSQVQALTIGTNGTNFANSIGAAGTNFANGIGTAGTNYTQAQLAATNSLYGFNLYSSNHILGTLATNFQFSTRVVDIYAAGTTLAIGAYETNSSLGCLTNPLTTAIITNTGSGFNLQTNGTTLYSSATLINAAWTAVNGSGTASSAFSGYGNGDSVFWTGLSSPTNRNSLLSAQSNNLVSSNLTWLTASNAVYQTQFTASNNAAQTYTLTASNTLNNRFGNVAASVVYVSPSGSDTNSGTLASPYYSFTNISVLNVVSNGGTAILRGGFYTNQTLSVPNWRGTIEGYEGETPTNYYGNYMSSNLFVSAGNNGFFTNLPGPAFLALSNALVVMTNTEIGQSYNAGMPIFQLNTPYGAQGSNNFYVPPLLMGDDGVTNRCFNYPLMQWAGGNPSSLANSNGWWALTNGVLVVKFAVSNVNADLMFPSVNPGDCFVSGGNSMTHLTVRNIWAQGAYRCFDASGCGWARFEDCLGYGGSFGSFAMSGGHHLELEECEFVAGLGNNVDIGSGYSGAPLLVKMNNCYIHDDFQVGLHLFAGAHALVSNTYLWGGTNEAGGYISDGATARFNTVQTSSQQKFAMQMGVSVPLGHKTYMGVQNSFVANYASVPSPGIEQDDQNDTLVVMGTLFNMADGGNGVVPNGVVATQNAQAYGSMYVNSAGGIPLIGGSTTPSVGSPQFSANVADFGSDVPVVMLYADTYRTGNAVLAENGAVFSATGYTELLSGHTATIVDANGNFAGTSLTSTNYVAIASNSVAPTPIALTGRLWTSNQDLYWVTTLKTNLAVAGH